MSGVQMADQAPFKNSNGVKTLYGVVPNKSYQVTPDLLMLGSQKKENNPYNEYNPEANHRRHVKSGLDQVNIEQPYKGSFDNADPSVKYQSRENPSNGMNSQTNHSLNNRPGHFRNRASTAAIRKPPLGVIATASARVSLGEHFNEDASERNANDVAEVLKVG